MLITTELNFNRSFTVFKKATIAVTVTPFHVGSTEVNSGIIPVGNVKLKVLVKHLLYINYSVKTLFIV